MSVPLSVVFPASEADVISELGCGEEETVRPLAGGTALALLPDLIIAATAELRGAEVLHVDSDYDLIAEVTGQPMRRLLDPGQA
jgi:hypothetical protein